MCVSRFAGRAYRWSFQHYLCSHRIGKAQPQYSYTLTPLTSYTHTHKHILHTPPTPFIPHTTLIPSTSSALDTIPQPRVTPTYSCHALIQTPQQHSRHPYTLSAYTHPIQTTVHASHRVPRQPYRQIKYSHMTTPTTQAQRPSSKSERNLIILQVGRGVQTAYS